MAKPILIKAQEQNPAEPKDESNIKIEFSKELLTELQNNTFSGRSEEDVIRHIGKVLEILDLVKITDVDPFQLRMKAFLLSLSKEQKNEYAEHEYGNPPKDSFPISYLNINNEKHKNCYYGNNGDADKFSGMDLNGAPLSENIINEQPNEEICRVDKFEVIRYTIGGNEEFLAICTRECDSWARTVNEVSSIYHDIFPKKDEGWTVHRTK
ncbi:hypothetical protein Tco_0250712 [Tanacetum coccineum]